MRRNISQHSCSWRQRCGRSHMCLRSPCQVDLSFRGGGTPNVDDLLGWDGPSTWSRYTCSSPALLSTQVPDATGCRDPPRRPNLHEMSWATFHMIAVMVDPTPYSGVDSFGGRLTRGSAHSRVYSFGGRLIQRSTDSRVDSLGGRLIRGSIHSGIDLIWFM